jgi:predicted PurR-regulated permease PerM
MEITWTTLWRIFMMLVLVAALFLAKEALVILFLSIIVSSALDAPVDYLERKKIPRIIGTFLIFIAVLAVLAFLLYALIPVMVFELQNLLSSIGKYQIPVFGSLHIPQLSEIDKYLDNLVSALLSGGASFFGVIASIFGGLAFSVATLVLSFYLTIDRNGVERFLRTILPMMHENYVIDIYLRARHRLGKWLQGQIVLMFIVGLAASLGLWLLGVKYSLILGVLAGVLEIVPVVGPIFAGVIAFLAAISESWVLGLYAAILFLAIQQLENHLLVPLVMKKAVGINPVVVVIALLAGSQIAGLIGAILAVPTAVVIQEIIADWEKRKLKSRRLEMR